MKRLFKKKRKVLHGFEYCVQGEKGDAWGVLYCKDWKEAHDKLEKVYPKTKLLYLIETSK